MNDLLPSEVSGKTRVENISFTGKWSLTTIPSAIGVMSNRSIVQLIYIISITDSADIVEDTVSHNHPWIIFDDIQVHQLESPPATRQQTKGTLHHLPGSCQNIIVDSPLLRQLRTLSLHWYHQPLL